MSTVVWAKGDRIRTRGGVVGTVTHPNPIGEIFVGVELEGIDRPAGMTFWPQASGLLRNHDGSDR